MRYVVEAWRFATDCTFGTVIVLSHLLIPGHARRALAQRPAPNPG